MKTPDAVLEDITRRLSARWHECLSNEGSAFPHSFPLGRPTAAELQRLRIRAYKDDALAGLGSAAQRAADV